MVHPLAAGIDVLPEKHAYSHAIALSSGAQAYLNLGDAKYLRALTNAWRFLEPQRFASGGWAPEEQFVHLSQGKLAESLKNSKAHFETPCGSYADIKLSIDTENPNLAALMRGAVMYVGLNPWDGIGEQTIDLPGSLSTAISIRTGIPHGHCRTRSGVRAVLHDRYREVQHVLQNRVTAAGSSSMVR